MSRKKEKSHQELPDVFVVRNVFNPEVIAEPLANLAIEMGKRAVFYNSKELKLPLFKLSAVDSYMREVKSMSESERMAYNDEFQSYLFGVQGSVDVGVIRPNEPIRTDQKTGEFVFDLDNDSDTDETGRYRDPNGRVDYMVHLAVRAIEDHFDTSITADHRGHNIGTTATKNSGLVHSHIVVGRINDEYLDHDYIGYKNLASDPYSAIEPEHLKTLPPFPSQITLGAMELVVSYRHQQARRARQLIYADDGRL